MAQWLIFIFCGLAWGSSFYWIKIALEELGPVTLVAYRLLFAVVGLSVVARVERVRFPCEPKALVQLAALAMLSPGIPFLLISWGETRIDSGMAAILNGTVPLLTIVAAHFLLADEKITGARALGLASGFLGILALFGRHLDLSVLKAGTLGQLAVLLASILYALSAVYSRQLLRRFEPVTISMGQMLFADLLAIVLVPILEWPPVFPRRTLTWVALIWMGLFGSCLSFWLYHKLVRVWGAVRSSLVNYMVPVVGLALGLVLRGERLDWYLLLGAVLVLSGILLVNYKALFSLRNCRPRRST